jgi:hypothetical protein
VPRNRRPANQSSFDAAQAIDLIKATANARPLMPLPSPIADPAHIAHRDIRRPDLLGGTIHEYQHAT